jgi:DNA-directed RNA polymerase specialized sigma24 family protein
MAGGYNRALVEHLLPAVWDSEAAYGIKAETSPDADMPKSQSDPKKGSPLFAHLADMRWAWRTAQLSLGERQTLVLRYGLDWTEKEIGVELGVTQQAISKRAEKAVGKLAAHLNGEDYIDGYDQIIEEEAA